MYCEVGHNEKEPDSAVAIWLEFREAETLGGLGLLRSVARDETLRDLSAVRRETVEVGRVATVGLAGIGVDDLAGADDLDVVGTGELADEIVADPKIALGKRRVGLKKLSELGLEDGGVCGAGHNGVLSLDDLNYLLHCLCQVFGRDFLWAPFRPAEYKDT